ncbi:MULTISPECIES: hypothetical protein [Pseudomonas]|uniref:Uncharacterized protein n=1 Tax=Pseudomonas tritici TaxID=2745518 RepID=A0A8H9YWQ9_9PSED|nr:MULTISPECIES: hypothetical protein [Pseudomonas]MBP2872643.1 hypothetical protein [Pseudomonas sp. SWRI144]QXH84057.1 hypothetical protein HU722_0000795 [Pseudomonas tritici]
MSEILPSSLPIPEFRKKKGRALARLDREQKMLESGPLGAERLLLNIAVDYMESHPNMSWDQALFAARAYLNRAHD